MGATTAYRFHPVEIIFSSNYSSPSVWDRLFRSWTETDEPEAIKLELNIYRDASWQNYPGIMLTPFKRSGQSGRT